MRYPPVALALVLSLGACDALTKKDAPQSKSDDDDGDEEKKEKRKKKKAEDDEEEERDDEPRGDLDPFVAKHLAIAEKVACGGGVEPWCGAAKGFGEGRAGPPKTGVVLGLATFVQTDGASKETLAKHQHVSTLAFREEGSTTFGFLAGLKPDNEGERAEVKRVEGHVLSVFGGRAKGRPAASPALSSYLASLSSTAKYEMKKHAGGYVLQGGSNAHVRRVGDHWVAVEVPRKNPAGIWFSVFSEATR